MKVKEKCPKRRKRPKLEQQVGAHVTQEGERAQDGTEQEEL
jgi:hypothetical protein